jgi:hypothetical protein
MSPADGSSFWDAVRSWADEAGLLLPEDPLDPPRPKVPQAVCDSCPICQAAATLEQVNPQVLVDLTEVARSVITGLGSALASAADQRTFGGGSSDPGDTLDAWDVQLPGEAPGDEDPGDEAPGSPADPDLRD